MWVFATLPFLLQAIAILVDEGYFHYKRGLPKWERIGHPIDTLTTLICLSIIVFGSFSKENLIIYIIFSIFSCLMITKDEFIHKEHCPGSENLLHAFLFILHPITLIAAALIWPVMNGIEVPPAITFWLDNVIAIKLFIYLQYSLMFLFFVYQILFWNFLWKDRPVQKL